ncbi:iron uptake transporter permease EfeU [Granulicoccus phenolivorans]|uniref:iron uptake transporter permease EfeU n=1 Tax=Granulicoccus phenolivorans TaxID=266854 RepID=UPI00040A7B6E|nr:iron uptake transporter permease EfeU [Granulicoccus phenolivorans]
MFLANFLIALREGVEMSLVVGIIAAYLIKSDNRGALRRMWLGVGIAAAVPLAFGAALTWGPKGLSFQAQEVIGGVLSLLAAALVTWMIFWMAKNARNIKGELEGQLSAATDSGGSAHGVIWIAALAVGREGLETALFLWATIKSSAENQAGLAVIGAVAGLVVSAIIGYAIFRGALRVNMRIFFLVTGYLLILVAAGVVSYGLGDLQEAGVLPGGSLHAWDYSALLPGQGSPLHWLYVLAQAMFQFNLKPTVLQVVGWLVYFIPTTIAFHLRSRIKKSPRPASIKENTPA